ncbi:hypothetical protein BD410DRAFT_813500 [Rickenella mellea]|uniref:Glycosyltransferase family 61 protein n=1 Tax=Rickenella mellea TaxID=50990 RepID=A0A4Y7QDW8_9AGAM|nr:hypothetical protein BD410DRAFT_813500 [Rickenella mellea]
MNLSALWQCRHRRRRERFIVFGLLVAFIFVSQHDVRVFSLESVKLDEVRGKEETGIQNTFSRPLLRDSRLSWRDTPPETRLLAHAPGYTMFDQLYVLNGTLFIVSPNSFYVTSRITVDAEAEEAKRPPTYMEIRIIGRAKARRLFGTSATRIDGPNWLVNDATQYIPHHFHFVAEVLFGLWRAYSSLDPHITPDGVTSIPPPRRDYASMNEWVFRRAFPSASMEFSSDWADRANKGRPSVFDRVLIFHRSAAHLGVTPGRPWRVTTEDLALHGSPHWWSTVRNNILEFSGLAPEWLLTPDPVAIATRQKFVITYVSRQGWRGGRMLRDEDHEELVNVVYMEKLTRAEQFQLSGRTTILMGVHGNGLTALMWMRPTPHSTVIEFFYPQGWAFDYEYTTRALGMVHYGVWNNITFTSPDVPPLVNILGGFHGNDIPVDGVVVADLVHRRLQLDQVYD